MSAPSGDQLRAAIDALRDDLSRRHGATHLDVEVAIDRDAQSVTVRGAVLVQRLVGSIEAALWAVLPPAWSVDASGVRVWAGGRWHALVERATLHARRDSDVRSTVLLPDDGPVQALARVGDDTLVRASDGTAGWLAGALGPEVDAPALARPRDAPPERVTDFAATYFGVPYSLGGTDEESIDCSGLVQRVLRRSHGIVVPRHTTDQRRIDPHAGEPPASAGHLAFVWTAAEAPCHVGIATPRAVIHASRSRSEVVEDPRERFFARATRIEHVPFTALVAFARQVAGHASLVAAGFPLGG